MHEALQSVMRALAMLEVMGVGPHSDIESVWGAAAKLWNVVEAELELQLIEVKEVILGFEDYDQQCVDCHGVERHMESCPQLIVDPADLADQY